MSTNKPEKVFKVGAVRASVFKNTVQQDGKEVPISKVILEVRYKDKAGEWKGTHSLSLNEMPKAILALQMAYQWLTTGRDWPAELDALSPLPPEDPAKPLNSPVSWNQKGGDTHHGTRTAREMPVLRQHGNQDQGIPQDGDLRTEADPEVRRLQAALYGAAGSPAGKGTTSHPGTHPTTTHRSTT